MPSQLVIGKGQVIEGNDAFLTWRAKVAKADALVLQANTQNAIVVTVWDLDARDPTAIIWSKDDVSRTTGGPEGGAVIQTALATDYWGGIDGEGYTVVYQLLFDTTGYSGDPSAPVSTGPTMKGGHRLKVELLIDMAAGAGGGGFVRLFTNPLKVLPSTAS